MKIPSLHIQGSGFPFIWLNGMLNSIESDSIYSLIDFDQLSKWVSVVRYDACDQSASGDYSWPAMTDELMRIVTNQNYDSMILGGCSMGSGTAIHAAVRYPEKVKGLILVTPPPAWEFRESATKVYKKVAAKTNLEKLPEFLKRILELNDDPPDFFEELHPGTRKRLLEIRLAFKPQYYTSIYHGGAVSDFPDREQISQIRVPSLIISNPEDAKHPIRIGRELNQLIQGSELIEVSNYSDYTKLQRTIRDFVCSIQHNNKS